MNPLRTQIASSLTLRLTVAVLFLASCSSTFAQQDQPKQVQPAPIQPSIRSGRNIPANAGDLSIRRSTPNPGAARVARLQYDGGGDWYWGASALPNFLRFVRDNTDIPVDTLEKAIRLTDLELSAYPFLFATGHGVIRFSEEEKEHLRSWLEAGGFLFVNDSYGMAENFLEEMKGIFPERQVIEPPFDHPIYHVMYDFPSGPPKIHQHDAEAPRGYGVEIDGRLAVYFLVESDIGDGWEDPQVHNDPAEKRDLALKMGANLLAYSMLY